MPLTKQIYVEGSIMVDEAVERAEPEKSIVQEDYTGLQLDTRIPPPLARFNNGPELPQLQSPDSTPSGTLRSHTRRPSSREAPMSLGGDVALKEVLYHPRTLGSTVPRQALRSELQQQELEPDEDRKRKRGFYVSWKILILIGTGVVIAVGAVLGGVLGSRHTSITSSSPSLPSSTSGPATPTQSQAALPSTINSELPKNYVMVASPLAPLAFPSDKQDQYSLFYQDASGNTTFTYKKGLESSWQSANVIFTDAANGSAITAINYPNGSRTQSTLFYIGNGNSKILDKRVNGSGYWDLGPLADSDLIVNGNFSIEGDGGFNGYRIAAVYSQHFAAGPGARIYFHQADGDSSWVQELVWTQKTDTWTQGSRLFGPTTDSHLCAMIEPQSQAVRLFYSTPDNAVKEIWWNITDQIPQYQQGVVLPGLLLHPSADFSVINLPDTNFLYYSTYLNPDSNVTIRELPIPFLPNTSIRNLTSVNVAEPALQANDTGNRNASVFIPLAAVASPENDMISVFYTEDALDPRCGYGSLKSIYRPINGTWGDVSYGQAQNQQEISLGNSN